MHPWIVPLSTSVSERQVGRKAATLARLLDAGFPIPDGLCLTTAALRARAAISAGLSLPDDLRAA